MDERALQAACPDCGRSLKVSDGEARPARCAACFDGYLRAIDRDFLASYLKLGVTSRRTVAETCLRGLTLESPPARKVLAVAIMEQFLLASSDLIGLCHALRNRDRESIARSFLSFRLDGEGSQAFFAALSGSPEELLADLGLPAPELVAARCPDLPARDAAEVATALRVAAAELQETARRERSALLLSELAASVRGGPALAHETSWLPQDGLRPDQVAALALDERRRQLTVQAIPVDERRLAEVVDAIDGMTCAASNLIYAYLVIEDEEESRRGSEGDA